ncbi:MAG: hypothetical protein V4850_07390 [Myxococcota bacterium]
MLLLLAPLAHALTCTTIVERVAATVPTAIVVDTLQEAGGVPAGTAACLARQGAPAPVVDAARAVELPPLPPSYVRARALAEAGEWDAAHAHLLGDSTLAGRYLDGVALTHLRRYGEALDAFAAVGRTVNAQRGERVTRVRAAELDNDRELAVLGIARVFHAAGDYPRAGHWYAKIGKRSPSWAQAQLEAAWGSFLSNDLVGTRTRLAAVRSAGGRMPGVLWLDLLATHHLYQPEDECRDTPPAVTWEQLQAAHATFRVELGAMRDRLTDPATLREVEDALLGETRLRVDAPSGRSPCYR